MAAHNQKWLMKTKISAIQGIAAKYMVIYYHMIVDIWLQEYIYIFFSSSSPTRPSGPSVPYTPCTLYSVHYTVYIIYSAHYTVHTRHSVHYTVYSVHWPCHGQLRAMEAVPLRVGQGQQDVPPWHLSPSLAYLTLFQHPSWPGKKEEKTLHHSSKICVTSGKFYSSKLNLKKN